MVPLIITVEESSQIIPGFEGRKTPFPSFLDQSKGKVCIFNPKKEKRKK